MILRLKFNYDGVDWKIVKDLFLQDLLCCWIYQLSILNISIIPVDSICGVLKVVTMSICNRVMTNSTIEYHNWLIEPSKFVAMPTVSAQDLHSYHHSRQ